MQSIFNWIKSNKLSSVLILIIAYAVAKQFFLGTMSSFGPQGFGRNASFGVTDSMGAAPFGGEYSKNLATSEYMPNPIPEAAPQPDVANRMMVKNANQSLYVKDVKESMEAIESFAKNIGGYTVSKSINEPQESSSGYITLRVPAEKLEETLTYFGEKAVRVVYESVSGNDITDQFVDTQEKLAILEKTKAIFVGMLDSATNFDQILRAQTEILNVQRQIDSVKGQIEYMEKTAEMSLVSVDLSTDELELGYSPEGSWRPGVVFKLAVRSLIGTARKAGNAVIWLGVYSVIWVPALIVVLVVRKRRRGNK